MFFIGGFNSIIPYVIYLSLIWTFVLFSFGGKITHWLHPKDPSPEKTIHFSPIVTPAEDASNFVWLDHSFQAIHAEQPEDPECQNCFEPIPLLYYFADLAPGNPSMQPLRGPPSVI